MNIKYRVAGVILKGDVAFAYKIFAGVYVFYLSPETYREAEESGLIDNDNEKYFSALRMEEIQYVDMLCCRGETARYRMDLALKWTTVGYLKEELEAVNELPEEIVFDYKYYNENPLATVTLNIRTHKVLLTLHQGLKGEMFDMERNWFNLALGSGYPGMLDLICGHLDRQFMNSRNLIRKTREFNESKFCQPPYKLEFRE